MLLLIGIDPAAIQIRGLQPEAMAEVLKNGDVDGMAVWEPFAFNILNSAPGAGVLTKPSAYVETFNLIASRTVCGARDDDLVKLLRALERAQHVIRTEPGKAKPFCASGCRLNRLLSTGSGRATSIGSASASPCSPRSKAWHIEPGIQPDR